ncbi:MAG TPA: TIGR03936 family radical SAM-associated protein [Gemmataceae bacterium]|nr:TIGR03936 family radical SAM-associated protein [Gemmataceae bacterium]
MVPDPAQAAPQPAPAPPAPPAARDKVRLRFRKAGDLRFLSHHDLMRTFERMLRRAGLPFHSTQGFHPKPRLVFCLSLSLGVVGREEAVELELTEPLDPEEVRARLAAEAPPGLEILSARRIDRRTTGQPRRVEYRVALPPDRAAGLSGPVTDLMNAAEAWVERTKPPPRRVNVRPYLDAVRVLAQPEPTLEMSLWVTPQGSARPDEVLRLLGLDDLLAAGAVLERTRLELHDEAASPEPEELTKGTA